ncbi:hypothetical protein CEXT_242141 [Caerostris extrusa]|uniref:Uncharacterized protein n=1 Tax=Caerostris extrusa TaxID=172846 RepID=A0AAV4X4Y5_CAEEX|nr:hypothetical protein CEXT_242141 [Caerostris extrusa]
MSLKLVRSFIGFGQPNWSLFGTFRRRRRHLIGTQKKRQIERVGPTIKKEKRIAQVGEAPFIHGSLKRAPLGTNGCFSLEGCETVRLCQLG